MCGLEGQIENMIRAGVDPAFQLQPGIWIDGCDNGTTSMGWTEPSLKAWLSFLGTHTVPLSYPSNPARNRTATSTVPLSYMYPSNQPTKELERLSCGQGRRG